MQNLRSFFVLTCLTIPTFLLPQFAYSQFSFDKIKDDTGFLFEKPLQFYWTPRYNRVEGLFANLGLKYRPPAAEGLNLYGDAGWGFWNESGEEFRFNLGVRQDFFELKRLSLGFDVFKKLESEDDWVVGEVENSLFAFFFREDYKDYYGAEGFRVYVDHKLVGRHVLRAELERRTYSALERNIDWSIFKGDFQPNPAGAPPLADSTRTGIIEGDELGLKLIAAFDWRDNPIFPLSGWYVQAIYEHTGEDFDTDGLFLTVKRFQQTFSNQRLLVRALLGTRRGSLADQHRIDLGGIGSLRAYDDKEFTGNRMALLNLNYLFGGDILQKIPLQNMPLFGTLWTTLSLGVFADVGHAVLVDPGAGMLSEFGDVFDDLQADVGLSLLVLDGVFRMDIARRTSSDVGKDDYRVTFRLLESF